MQLQKKPLQVAIGATVLALLLLLGYSLERTVWLFALFEERAELAIAAAIVVELAAVALLAGAGIIAGMDVQAKAWANRALAAVLSVQALANLSAGYLRGGQRTRALWSVEGDWFGYAVAAYTVAAALWLVTNLAVPALILCLSKLLEQMLSQYAKLPAAQKEEKKHSGVLRPAVAHQKPVNTVAASVVVTDGECKYCHQTSLSAIEKARHGKAYKKNGVC
jgi:hypothetical protein